MAPRRLVGRHVAADGLRRLGRPAQGRQPPSRHRHAVHRLARFGAGIRRRARDGLDFRHRRPRSGIAGEACRAVLDWADAELDPTPIWAIISPENSPSRALAARLGFTEIGESPYNGEPIVVLRRDPKA
ncbi:GNAT family N-acetyltransferase [Sphingomonas rhizophila]|uniref:GNAT family N-acetyltransferase n=1 Tax=Sphingomonas rhizophila TaxID=2071607 RepID=A0A7G9SDH4_9SPHN|nr:GNAT family N-acetyltransferase [Sphingomonas rhizophila]